MTQRRNSSVETGWLAVLVALALASAVGCGDDDTAGSDGGDDTAGSDGDDMSGMDGGSSIDGDGAIGAGDVPSPIEIADIFESLWGEADADVRETDLARIMAPDGQMVGQGGLEDGREAVATNIAGFPRVNFSDCEVDVFAIVGDFIQFTTICTGVGDTADTFWTKYGRLGDDGRLILVVIFSDPITETAFPGDLAALTQVAETNEAAWTEADEATRKAMLEGILTEDAIYYQADGMNAVGVDELSDLMVRIGNPNWDHLEVTGGPQEHHSYMRFGVRGIDMDGAVDFVGEKFGQVSDDDKIVYLVYFGGVLPTDDTDAGTP